MRLIINLSLLFSPPSSQILGWEWRESGGMGMGRESGEKRERKKEELPPSPFKHWKKPAHSLLLSCARLSPAPSAAGKGCWPLQLALAA